MKEVLVSSATAIICRKQAGLLAGQAFSTILLTHWGVPDWLNGQLFELGGFQKCSEFSYQVVDKVDVMEVRYVQGNSLAPGDAMS